MATEPFISAIQHTTNPAQQQNTSQEWLREQLRNFSGTTDPRSLLRATPNQKESRLVTKLSIGRMYLFYYDPKMKEELPYYDRFPLIFPFRMVEDGFYGINMHYLPHVLRARLMDGLYTLANNDKNDDTTKLKLTYQLLNSSSRFKYVKPCVKHYLNNHVRSRFLWVPADQWKTALFLPLERFAKASATTVWQQSRRSVR